MMTPAAPPSNAEFEQAKQWFLQGNQALEAGHLAKAIQCYEASLRALPGRPSTLLNLGLAHLRLGQAREALVHLDDGISQAPADGAMHHARGLALMRLGDTDQARRAWEQAVRCADVPAQAWADLGSLYREMRLPQQALASLQRALSAGVDAEVVKFQMAGLDTTLPVPKRPPQAYVQALFDEYAAGFNDHLNQLGYRIPQALAVSLSRWNPQPLALGLDLGCGTGLVAQALHPQVLQWDGLDLSAAMLQHAQQTGAYRHLYQRDAASFLQSTSERYDVVIAADVLIYVGALDELWTGVHRVLNASGWWGVSVELCTTPGYDYELRASLRFAHSLTYLRRLCDRYGFSVCQVEPQVVRQEQGHDIAGLCVWMQKA